jgi:rhamnosyltransferase
VSLATKNPSLDDVCAVVVTFHPDEAVLERLATMRSQSGMLLIVDNGSDEQTLASLRGWSERVPDVELLPQGRNIGLACALNLGLDRALNRGFEYAVTYDQDSVPATDMVRGLLDCLREHPQPQSLAVIGPTIVDRNAPIESYRWLAADPRFPLFFERVAVEHGWRDDVTFVITSGSLMPLTVYRELGPLREDLFIDYVDHEYCLRARTAGYRILATGNARLLHALGDKREFRVGTYAVRPTFHGAERLYYIYRNRLPLLRRYGLLEPHWVVFDVLATTHNLLRVALFENERRRKLGAALQGTVDGFLGRLGPRRQEQPPA